MMKQIYSKPKISVEVLTLDHPIAANCTADKDDVLSLMEFGYFTEAQQCSTNFNNDMEWGNDTVCYHTNVQTAFLS